MKKEENQEDWQCMNEERGKLQEDWQCMKEERGKLGRLTVYGQRKKNT